MPHNFFAPPDEEEGHNFFSPPDTGPGVTIPEPEPFTMFDVLTESIRKTGRQIELAVGRGFSQLAEGIAGSGQAIAELAAEGQPQTRGLSIDENPMARFFAQQADIERRSREEGSLAWRGDVPKGTAQKIALGALELSPQLATVGVAGPTLGVALLGFSAGGNEFREALDKGATQQEAFASALITGASEAALERFLGDAPIIRRIRGQGPEVRTTREALGQLVKQGNMEGMEEALSFLSNRVGQEITFSDEGFSQDDIVGALENYGVGAAMAVLPSLFTSRAQMQRAARARGDLPPPTQETPPEPVGDTENDFGTSIEFDTTEVEDLVGEDVDPAEADRIRTQARREAIDLLPEEERLAEARVSRRVGELPEELLTVEEAREDLTPDQAVQAFERGILPLEFLTAQEQTRVKEMQDARKRLEEEGLSAPEIVRLREILDRGPESPGMPAPVKPNPQREGNRLLRNRIRLEFMRNQVIQEKRIPLEEDFAAELTEMVSGVLVPKEVRSLLDTTIKAKTHLQVANPKGTGALDRVIKKVDNEIRRRAGRHLKELFQRARRMRLRPEFMEGVENIIDDIDLVNMSEATKKTLQATADFLDESSFSEDVEPEEIRKRQFLLPGSRLRGISRLNKRSIRDVHPEELWQMAKDVQHAIHLSQTKNKMIGRQRGRAVSQEVQTITEEAADNIGVLTRQNIRGTDLEGPLKRRKAFNTFAVFMASPEVSINYVSPRLNQLVFEDLRIEGGHRRQEIFYELADPLYDEIQRTLGFPMESQEFRNWLSQEVEIETKQGLKKLTRAELGSLYGSTKDPYIKEGLRRERGISLNKSRNTTGLRFGLTAEQVFTAVENADPQLKALVDFVFTMYNGPNAQILDDAWVENFGYGLTNPDYFPSKVDADFRITGRDPLQMMAQFEDAGLKSWGSTKERIGTKAPLEITNFIDQYLNHAQNTARLAAYLPHVRNISSVLGRPETKGALKGTAGAYFLERVLDSVKLETTPPFDKDTVSWLTRNVFQRLTPIGVLGYRLSVPLLNNANLAIAAAKQEGGFRHMIEPGDFSRENVQRITALMAKHSPVLRARYDAFLHHETGGFYGQQRRTYGRRNFGRDLAMGMAQFSDRRFSVKRWMMAEQFIREQQPDLEEGTDQFNDAVARQSERLLVLSESNASGGGLSGFLGLGRRFPMAGLYTAFMNAPSRVFSAGVEGVLLLERGIKRQDQGRAEEAAREIKQGMKLISAFATSAMIVGIVRTSLRALKGTGDDEETITGSVARDAVIEGLSLVPLVGDAVLVPVTRQITGRGFYTFGASLLDDTLDEAANFGSGLFSLIQDILWRRLETDGERRFLRDAKKTLKAASKLSSYFGVPTEGGKDIGLIMWNAVKRSLPEHARQTAEDTLKPLPGLTQEKQQASGGLFRAVNKQDKKQFREALLEMRRVGMDTDFSNLRASVRGRFNRLARVDPESPAFDAEFLERQEPWVKEYYQIFLDERDYALTVLEEMAREHPDLVRFGRRTRRRRGRTTRRSR